MQSKKENTNQWEGVIVSRFVNIINLNIVKAGHGFLSFVFNKLHKGACVIVHSL